MKLYNHKVFGDLSNANNVMINGFSFGNHQNINEEAIDYVVEKIKEFILKKKN